MDKSVAGGRGQLKGRGLERGRKERQSLETACLASEVFCFFVLCQLTIAYLIC